MTVDASTLVLGIETSCDETAAAVFTDDLVVRSSVVASQTDLHARFGGVVPEIASRAHLRNLLPVIDEALSRAGIGVADVGCLAVHHTPGLVGALLVIPFILAYTAMSYYVFRGKVKAGEGYH